MVVASSPWSHHLAALLLIALPGALTWAPHTPAPGGPSLTSTSATGLPIRSVTIVASSASAPSPRGRSLTLGPRFDCQGGAGGGELGLH